jgi:hypothetical protein
LRHSEAVLRQDTETFLRCLENGLRAFDGVPLLLNSDNLKAAVLKADWFDPEINPKWLNSAGTKRASESRQRWRHQAYAASLPTYLKPFTNHESVWF